MLKITILLLDRIRIQMPNVILFMVLVFKAGCWSRIGMRQSFVWFYFVFK